MPDISQQKRSELRDHLLELAVTCPVEQCNPMDCPLQQVRRMDLGRRLEWFQSLSDEDLAYLNAYHYVCLKTRLGLGLNEATSEQPQPA